jgi:hypothetical protein
MYTSRRKKLQTELPLFDFKLPFGGSLDPKNRWIRLASLVPWDDIDAEYSRHFGDTGNDALSSRMALGAIIIKERLKLTDEETVAQIQENPYLQYFVGLPEYTTRPPFDSSLMVHFRLRINFEMLKTVNEKLCAAQRKEKTEKKRDTGNNEDPPANSGRLIIDATCVPEDIRHPTDVSLLNDAREHTERVIDQLWELSGKEGRKPRTYREKARKQYLQTIRRRQPPWSHIRKGIRQQLGFIRRNLQIIKEMSKAGFLPNLCAQDYKKLLVAAEVCRQQREMYKSLGRKDRRIEDRIVSLSKPHVRPIVRGKAAANVEFGAKVSVSVIDGKSYLDRLSWDAYNESVDLQKQAESFKEKTGSYPESIHADKIYRTRNNQAWCKERNIRLSGPQLGRPLVDDALNKARKKVQRLDEIIRIQIEGKFGTAKRKYRLNRIMTKIQKTSETTIALIFLVMNLDAILRDILLSVLNWLLRSDDKQRSSILMGAA